MKTKDVIIALMAVAIVVLSVLYAKAPQNCDAGSADCPLLPRDSCCVDSTDRLDEFLDDKATFCASLNKQHGRSFSEDKIDSIIDFIRAGKEVNEYDQIYGFQLGIDHINEMVKDIRLFDSINNAIGNGLRINGIRLYEAVSKRPIDGKEVRKADLVMVPYTTNGKDVFDVDISPLLENQLKMYAWFRPCPRICGRGKLFPNK